MKAYKEINLTLLEKELKETGIIVNGLGMEGNEIFTYDEHGAIIKLPSTAQAIIELHEYDSEPQPPSLEDQMLEKDKQIQMLQAQLQASTDRADFQEEVLTEIIMALNA